MMYNHNMDNKTALQQQSIAQAQQVLMLLFYQPNMTIRSACEKVGITERKYRYWLASGDEAIERTRELIDAQQRELISEIAIAKGEIIRKMISQATESTTKPLDRVALYNTLNEELNLLQGVYNVRPGIEEKAHEFLKQGPKTTKKKSRFASLDIKESEDGVQIDIIREEDVIDADFTERED